jgi:hypothetical protein
MSWTSATALVEWMATDPRFATGQERSEHDPEALAARPRQHGDEIAELGQTGMWHESPRRESQSVNT